MLRTCSQQWRIALATKALMSEISLPHSASGSCLRLPMMICLSIHCAHKAENNAHAFTDYLLGNKLAFFLTPCVCGYLSLQQRNVMSTIPSEAFVISIHLTLTLPIPRHGHTPLLSQDPAYQCILRIYQCRTRIHDPHINESTTYTTGIRKQCKGVLPTRQSQPTPRSDVTGTQ